MPSKRQKRKQRQRRTGEPAGPPPDEQPPDEPTAAAAAAEEAPEPPAVELGDEPPDEWEDEEPVEGAGGGDRISVVMFAVSLILLAALVAVASARDEPGSSATPIAPAPGRTAGTTGGATTGGGATGGGDGGSAVPNVPAGTLFAATCATCHALPGTVGGGGAGLGGSGGETLGPDLGRLQPSRQRVLAAIRNGGRGSGQMPAGLLGGEAARRVAAYVARQAAGG